MPRKQWVNLPRDASFVRGEIESINQLGQEVMIEGRIDPPRVGRLKVSITRGSDMAEWTRAELRRNASVEGAADMERTLTTSADGRFTVSFRVSQAGGDEWTVRVTDEQGREELLETVQTVRRLYYRVVRMNGTRAPSLAPVISAFLERSDRCFLELEQFAGEATIEDTAIVDKNDEAGEARVVDAAMAAFGRPRDDRKYVCIFLALQVGMMETVDVEIPDVQPAGSETTVTLTGHITRGYGLYEHWEDGKPWFGTATHGARTIARGDIRATNAQTLVIRSSALQSGAHTLELGALRTVHAVGGFSQSASNLVAIATKSGNSGRILDAEYVRSLIIHEIGHKVGLVPGSGVGSFSFLARQSTHYSDVDDNIDGHVGPHCRDRGACAMFGTIALGVHPEQLCDPCKVSLRRSDMRPTWLERAGRRR